MSELKQEANVVPALAIAPPAKPTIKPGRSAILIAMKPARIGSMKLNATPPAVLKNAAIGVFIPKLDGSIE